MTHGPRCRGTPATPSSMDQEGFCSPARLSVARTVDRPTEPRVRGPRPRCVRSRRIVRVEETGAETVGDTHADHRGPGRSRARCAYACKFARRGVCVRTGLEDGFGACVRPLRRPIDTKTRVTTVTRGVRKLVVMLQMAPSYYTFLRARLRRVSYNAHAHTHTPAARSPSAAPVRRAGTTGHLLRAETDPATLVLARRKVIRRRGVPCARARPHTSVTISRSLGTRIT